MRFTRSRVLAEQTAIGLLAPRRMLRGVANVSLSRSSSEMQGGEGTKAENPCSETKASASQESGVDSDSTSFPTN